MVATFLDIGLFKYFSIIFPLLLIFVIMFAILTKTKLFGENKGLHAIIAFCIAMIVLLTPGVVQVINVMAPWFVLIFIFFVLLLVSFKFLGVSDKSITDYMSKDFETAHWFVLSFALIIFIGAIASVYGGSLLPYSKSANATVDSSGANVTQDSGDFNSNVGRTIFHPKTIGMIFILLVGSFTIRLLAGKEGGK